jgi:large subunit ribosomal protein L18
MDKKNALRERRKKRVRHVLKKCSSQNRLRLCVNRTNQHTYAQIVDDTKAITLVAASTLEEKLNKIKNGSNKEAAALVGKLIAEKAIEKGIKKVVFDRSGFLYHGRIKALADGARQNGLEF